ncbi:MAG: class I SAM-dependent methyltransferase, partial [Ktedonobacteraceae bacterium]|nr:class I SAM-dependent methyltransferase [Ktedonobacteraceae bacterium]
MYENINHPEELEYPKHGKHGKHKVVHHHVEESGHREHRKGYGGRGRHHYEVSERLERGEGGLHHHVSWHIADEVKHRHGGRRERVERGMLRYLLLDALRHGPKHGYEMIKWIEEQTYGRYAPSPGTVYPTLQLLEDQGLLLAERADEKSVYHLTETGEAELQTQADFIQDFWERYGHPEPPASTLLASDFVHEELQNLQSTVEKGVRVLTQQADQQSLLRLRQVLEHSKNEIRGLLTHGSASQQRGAGTPDTPVNARELEEAIAHMFASEDEALRQTLTRAREHGLPSIAISALQGKLLQVLARACQARKILEIGALAGYSGIWLARALPAGGRLITLEIDASHAEVVRESFRQAQVDDRAEVRVGPALETLPLLSAEGPFDLIFIDADKDSYPQYLAWAIQLARPGSIIVADNCVQGGNGLRVQEAANPRGAGIR